VFAASLWTLDGHGSSFGKVFVRGIDLVASQSQHAKVQQIIVGIIHFNKAVD
jgi:hypothetical protein